MVTATTMTRSDRVTLRYAAMIARKLLKNAHSHVSPRSPLRAVARRLNTTT